MDKVLFTTLVTALILSGAQCAVSESCYNCIIYLITVVFCIIWSISYIYYYNTIHHAAFSRSLINVHNVHNVQQLYQKLRVLYQSCRASYLPYLHTVIWKKYIEQH